MDSPWSRTPRVRGWPCAAWSGICSNDRWSTGSRRRQHGDGYRCVDDQQGAPSSIPTAARSTPRPRAPGPATASGCAAPWDAPASVWTTPWRRPFSPRSRSNWSTAPTTRPGPKPERTSSLDRLLQPPSAALVTRLPVTRRVGTAPPNRTPVRSRGITAGRISKVSGRRGEVRGLDAGKQGGWSDGST